MSPSNEAERMEMSRVPYASAMGSLMFAMICTRPDIAQAVGAVSRFISNPGREHRLANLGKCGRLHKRVTLSGRIVE